MLPYKDFISKVKLSLFLPKDFLMPGKKTNKQTNKIRQHTDGPFLGFCIEAEQTKRQTNKQKLEVINKLRQIHWTVSLFL